MDGSGDVGCMRREKEGDRKKGKVEDKGEEERGEKWEWIEVGRET